MESETQTFKTCKTCNMEKPLNLFREKYKSCRKCNNDLNYNKLKEKNYFKEVYIKNKEQRLQYQKNLYHTKYKILRMNNILSNDNHLEEEVDSFYNNEN